MGRRGTTNQTSENRATQLIDTGPVSLEAEFRNYTIWQQNTIHFHYHATQPYLRTQNSTLHLWKLLFEWLYRNKKMKSKAQNAKSSQTLKSIGGQKRYRIATPCLILYLSPRCGNDEKCFKIVTDCNLRNGMKCLQNREEKKSRLSCDPLASANHPSTPF